MAYRAFGSYSRSSDTDKELVIRVWIGSIVAVIAMYVYMIWIGQFDKLWNVTAFNFQFYFVVFILWVIGVIWWKKNETFTKLELAIFAIFVPLSAFPACSLGFLFLTKLGDTEVLNGYTQSVEYTERYYTESESTDKDGHKSKTTTWHGPYYDLYSSVGKVSLDENSWHNYVQLWGGPGRVTERFNLSADGPPGAGIQTIEWDGRDETKLPVSVPHIYVNYVKGSDSAIKTVGAMKGYEGLLRSYPQIYSGAYGDIYFNRIIAAGTSVDPNFSSTVDTSFDLALRTLGESKEANIIVYVAGTEDVGFYHALDEYWSKGKKNDICIVIGYTNDKIHWCKIMTYTLHELFKQNLEMKVRQLQTLNGNGSKFVETVLTQITAPGDEGYERLPMKHFKYLAAGIRMPIWASIIVILFGAISQLPTIWLFIYD